MLWEKPSHFDNKGGTFFHDYQNYTPVKYITLMKRGYVNTVLVSFLNKYPSTYPENMTLEEFKVKFVPTLFISHIFIYQKNYVVCFCRKLYVQWISDVLCKIKFILSRPPMKKNFLLFGLLRALVRPVHYSSIPTFNLVERN